jgi:hypothetical protein
MGLSGEKKEGKGERVSVWIKCDRNKMTIGMVGKFDKSSNILCNLSLVIHLIAFPKTSLNKFSI